MAGTPKTLAEAISNGLAHAAVEGAGPDQTVAMVQAHVRDLLAQRFGVLMMSDIPEVAAATKVLWESLGFKK